MGEGENFVGNRQETTERERFELRWDMEGCGGGSGHGNRMKSAGQGNPRKEEIFNSKEIFTVSSSATSRIYLSNHRCVRQMYQYIGVYTKVEKGCSLHVGEKKAASSLVV